MQHTLTTREVVDADAPGLIALVGDAYAEYPGCVLDLDGVDADLRAPARAAGEARARWWVVEAGDALVGSVAAGPGDEPGEVELQRLYVAPAVRRRGLGAELVARVEEEARRLEAQRVTLWSDTRFLDAHRLYRRLGYVETGRRRRLEDPSETTELEFTRRLG